MTKISRRDFFRITGTSLGAIAAQQILSSCGIKPEQTTGSIVPTNTPFQAGETATDTPSQTEQPTTEVSQYPHLVVTRGEDIEKMVRQGIQAIGGIERFMKSGANVIIKPNTCISYHTYEYAATTNPWVVGALVKLCVEAGASRVRVMDYPFGGTPENCYINSGIEEQVLAAGGEMEVMSTLKYVTKEIENPANLKKVMVYEDVLNPDLLINVPIAKHHSMAKLTLGMKNLMGIILNREAIHPSFEMNLVDLATLVRPQLTVIDAIRTLMANGPTGGNLADVKQQNTVIFSPDIVAADAYATRLFDMVPSDIDYIMSAAARGLGMADLSGLKIEEINVNA